MAAQTFASMVPDISAFLQNCPSLVIERTIRKVVQDLCQRARVWRVEMTPVTLAIGTVEYQPASPVAYGEYMEFISGHTVVDGAKRDIKWASFDKTRRMYPEWPLNTAGTPVQITSRRPGYIMVAPAPDAVGALTVYGVLRPTATADSWEDYMYREFSREVFHGVVQELMLMVGRSWYDPKMAQYHGKQWTYLLNLARDRADRDYNTDDISVQMRPAA